MDARYVRRWRAVSRRRQGGEDFLAVLASLSTPELVEALAGSAKEDPVAANVIAVAILNRFHRARLLGAAIGIFGLSLASGIVLLTADLLMTGTFGLIERQPFGLDVAAVAVCAFAAALVALVVALATWRTLGSPRRP